MTLTYGGVDERPVCDMGPNIVTDMEIAEILPRFVSPSMTTAGFYSHQERGAGLTEWGKLLYFNSMAGRQHVGLAIDFTF